MAVTAGTVGAGSGLPSASVRVRGAGVRPGPGFGSGTGSGAGSGSGPGAGSAAGAGVGAGRRLGVGTRGATVRGRPGVRPLPLLLDLSVLQQLFGKVVGELVQFGLLSGSTGSTASRRVLLQSPLLPVEILLVEERRRGGGGGGNGSGGRYVGGHPGGWEAGRGAGGVLHGAEGRG